MNPENGWIGNVPCETTSAPRVLAQEIDGAERGDKKEIARLLPNGGVQLLADCVGLRTLMTGTTYGSATCTTSTAFSSFSAMLSVLAKEPVWSSDTSSKGAAPK